VAGGGNIAVGSELSADVSGFSTTSNSAGFFKFCGVPAGIRLELQAQSDNRRSNPAEVMIPGTQTGRMTVLQVRGS
jgi:hypothetical protein